MQNYQQEAQSQLQKKEAELFQPILEKAQLAIAEVGKENGFIYIFDISSKVVLFQSDKSIDVMPLVKKKLGME
ncbi:MAG: OmpH family outer membrane protein [Bacteroidales bacterium]|nr:OmpH family outer membrane protein [Bacteroidales bacterium]